MSSLQTPSASHVSTIGVFDSGFGGLTVLRALIARLPRAHFAFIGDTARLPYGSKSRRTIARYAVESARFLVREQGAEFLVIACNTASALALDAIQDAVPVPVLGVIEPGATAARAASRSNDVLVIATDATVQSHAYRDACNRRGLRAFEKACPLLVPLVEEGWTGPAAFPAAIAKPELPYLETASAKSMRLAASSDLHKIPAEHAYSDFAPDLVDCAAQPASAPPQVAVTNQVIRIYLDELIKTSSAQGLKPDTLVLGCTHYPLLRPLIERAVPSGMRVIDSAESAAASAARLVNGHATAAEPGAAASDTEIRCFATDSVEKFERLGSRFLGRPVGQVQLVDLGG